MSEAGSAIVMFWQTRQGRWPWEIMGTVQKEGSFMPCDGYEVSW